MNNRDKIECRFSEPVIRQMYAKFLAGRGNLTLISDIPKRLLVKAFATPYEELIEALALYWEGFEGLIHLKIEKELT